MGASDVQRTSDGRMPIDHLVYAVPNLEKAVQDFEARLGAPPRPGRRHEGLGTHNAILPLEGLVYVELIAIDPLQDSPGRPRPFGLDDLAQPRLVTWAARTVDIESVVALARKRGFDPGTVLDLKRAPPSGETISWKLTVRREPAGDGLVPFVIDWADATHPASGGPTPCRLESFSAQHPEPAVIEEALAALDVALDVEHAAVPRLTAVVSGPGGRITLDSLAKPPQAS